MVLTHTALSLSSAQYDALRPPALFKSQLLLESQAHRSLSYPSLPTAICFVFSPSGHFDFPEKSYDFIG
jgi:hypothetical protein